MIVWSLQRCEEYWMQESHGLFATREAALASIPNRMLVVEEATGETIVVGQDDSHYRQHAKHAVILPANEYGHETEVTLDNVGEFIDGGFSFYSLAHNGYPVWGIFPTEVHTSPQEIK